MTQTMKQVLLAVGCTALSWSCTEPQTGDAPLALGAEVVHEQWQPIVMSGDPDSGLFVTTGVGADDVQRLCGGPRIVDRDPVDARVVSTPGGVLAMQFSGDVRALVFTAPTGWAYTNDFGEFFAALCEAVAGPPIARGMAAVKYTESLGPQGDHWGLKAHGELTDDAGQPVQLTHAGQCVWGRWPDSELFCNVHIALH